jgi:hypothetical protein
MLTASCMLTVSVPCQCESVMVECNMGEVTCPQTCSAHKPRGHHPGRQKITRGASRRQPVSPAGCWDLTWPLPSLPAGVP